MTVGVACAVLLLPSAARGAGTVGLGATVGQPLSWTASGGGGTFTLEGAPTGMTISPHTGELTWTPAPGQGSTSVVVRRGDDVTTLQITVTAAAVDLSKSIFIAPDGSDGGDGSAAAPYGDLQKACPGAAGSTILPAGWVIYFRGGEYRNPGNGTATPGTWPRLDCSGVPGDRLEVRPWGNERPKLKFDGLQAFDITGSDIELSGFEVEGEARDITLAEVLDTWWSELDDTNRLQGTGIVFKGTNVLVRGNVVHATPGSGISGGPGGGDGGQIVDNLVYDVNWWSTRGTSAIKMNQIDDAGRTPDPPQLRAQGNVVLNSESRIVSHVFSKRAVEMIIDEGGSLLLQAAQDANNPGAADGDYTRGFDIRENLFANNGKGAALRSAGIDFRNNTLSNNGTTLEGTAAGIRLNDAITSVQARDNAVAVPDGTRAVDVSQTVLDGNLSPCTGNLLRGPLQRADACLPGTNGNAAAERPFVDAHGFDFRVRPEFTGNQGAGVPPARLAEFRDRITRWGAPTSPTGWCVDKAEIVAGILANIPADGVRSQLDADTIRVTFPDASNSTGENRIDLNFDGDEDDGPDHVDLCGLVEDRTYSGTITDISATGWVSDISASSGSAPVQRAELLVDGVVVATDTTAPFTDLDLPTPAGTGTLSVAARVFDAAGRSLTSGAVRIAYDNTTPAPGGPAPAPGGPVAAPTPAPPVAVPLPGQSLPALQPLNPAKLEVRRAGVDRSAGRLSVLAPITARASGTVRVAFRAAGRTERFTTEIDRSRARILIARRLPAAQVRAGSGIFTLTYPGDADTQPQEVRLRAAGTPAGLRAGRPQLVGSRLTAAGTVDRRARGVVRLQLLYEPASGPTRTLTFTAPISGGRYRLAATLPADTVREIAARRGVLHSYTLFTGHQAADMRGELESFEVLRAP